MNLHCQRARGLIKGYESNGMTCNFFPIRYGYEPSLMGWSMVPPWLVLLDTVRAVDCWTTRAKKADITG